MKNTQTTRRTSRNRVLDAMKTLGAVAVALGLSFFGGRAAQAQATTQEAEGNVEIWINNTKDTTDDVVARSGTTPCQIHLTGAMQDMNIVLVSPPISGANNLRRLGLSTPGTSNGADGSLSLTLAKDATWKSFYIDGRIGSDNIFDAKVEAHKNTANGDVKTTASASVYWLEQPKTELTQGGLYALSTNVDTEPAIYNGVAVSMHARYKLNPSGLGAAPQLQNMGHVALVQNATSVDFTRYYSAPYVIWKTGVSKTARVVIPESKIFIKSMPLLKSKPVVGKPLDIPHDAPFNDSNAANGLYHGATSPVTGAGEIFDVDGPNSTLPPLTFDAIDDNDKTTVVGTVVYKKSIAIDASFLDWTILYKSSNNSINPLRESDWSLHVNSANPFQFAQANAADYAPKDPLAPLTPTVPDLMQNHPVEDRTDGNDITKTPPQ